MDMFRPHIQREMHSCSVFHSQIHTKHLVFSPQPGPKLPGFLLAEQAACIVESKCSLQLYLVCKRQVYKKTLSLEQPHQSMNGGKKKNEKKKI